MPQTFEPGAIPFQNLLLMVATYCSSLGIGCDVGGHGLLKMPRTRGTRITEPQLEGGVGEVMSVPLGSAVRNKADRPSPTTCPLFCFPLEVSSFLTFHLSKEPHWRSGLQVHAWAKLLIAPTTKGVGWAAQIRHRNWLVSVFLSCGYLHERSGCWGYENCVLCPAFICDYKCVLSMRVVE